MDAAILPVVVEDRNGDDCCAPNRDEVDAPNVGAVVENDRPVFFAAPGCSEPDVADEPNTRAGVEAAD